MTKHSEIERLNHIESFQTVSSLWFWASIIASIYFTSSDPHEDARSIVNVSLSHLVLRHRCSSLFQWSLLHHLHLDAKFPKCPKKRNGKAHKCVFLLKAPGIFSACYILRRYLEDWIWSGIQVNDRTATVQLWEGIAGCSTSPLSQHTPVVRGKATQTWAEYRVAWLQKTQLAWIAMGKKKPYLIFNFHFSGKKTLKGKPSQRDCAWHEDNPHGLALVLFPAVEGLSVASCPQPWGKLWPWLWLWLQPSQPHQVHRRSLAGNVRWKGWQLAFRLKLLQSL